MKNLFIVVALLLSVNAHAQQNTTQLVYAAYDNGTTNPQPTSFPLIDPLYNTNPNTIVCLASCTGTNVDMDYSLQNRYNVPSTNNYLNYFILKTDSNLKPYWHKPFIKNTNPAYEITINSTQIDNNHNLYIAGDFKGTFDFDPSDSVRSITSKYFNVFNPSPDAFMAKYDTAFNLVWIKVFTKATATNSGVGIVDFEVSADGKQIYTKLDTYNGTGADINPQVRISNAYGYNPLVKFDAGGNYEWHKTFLVQGYYEPSYNIAINSKNELIMTGYGGSTQYPVDLDWGAGNFFITGNKGGSFVAKYTGNGTFLDAIIIENLPNPYYGGNYLKLSIDKYDNIITYGIFNGIFQPNPNDTAFTLTGHSIVTAGGFVPPSAIYVCYNDSLHFKWANKIYHPLGSLPYYANSNGISIFHDYSNQSSYFIAQTNYANSPDSIEIHKVDSLGNLTAKLQFQTKEFYYAINEPNSFMFTGYTDFNVCDLNPDSARDFTVPIYSVFVARYSNYTVGSIGTTAPTPAPHSNNVKVYPNPARGNINVQFGEGWAGSATVAIYDAMGKKIMSQPTQATTTAINLSGLAAGIYTLKVSGNNANTTQKLVVY
jgi:hypothetical protein